MIYQLRIIHLQQRLLCMSNSFNNNFYLININFIWLNVIMHQKHQIKQSSPMLIIWLFTNPKACGFYGIRYQNCSSNMGNPYDDQHLNHKFWFKLKYIPHISFIQRSIEVCSFQDNLTNLFSILESCVLSH